MKRKRDKPFGVPLLPKQYEFIASDAPRILYSGAFGAGKSRALCYRAIRLALHPGARVGLCRKALSFLKNTTLKTLLERDGDLPPVLPEGTYQYCKTPGESTIRIKGGGEIMPFGFDEPTRVGSMFFSDICIDEAIELDKEEWDMLCGRARIRFKLPDGRPNTQTIAVATNPGGPDHFLYRMFYEDPAPEYHLINTTTSENWFLPRSYIRLLAQSMSGPAKERYLKGVWCAYEGAVFQMFSLQRHCIPMKENWLRYVAGVDIGFTHPSVVRVHGMMENRWHHVVAEFHQKCMTVDELVEACVAVEMAYRPVTFVVDPARPDVIVSLKRAGLDAREAINDREAGISAISNGFAMVNEQGVPRFTMEPGLQGNLEYLSYRWKKSKGDGAKENVIKQNDDAVDADRYAVMEIMRSSIDRRLTLLNRTRRDDFVAMFAPEDREELVWMN